MDDPKPPVVLPEGFERLSPRDREVVVVMCTQGDMTLDAAADAVGMRRGTLNYHLRRIYGRLRVHTRVKLIHVMTSTDGLKRCMGQV